MVVLLKVCGKNGFILSHENNIPKTFICSPPLSSFRLREYESASLYKNDTWLWGSQPVTHLIAECLGSCYARSLLFGCAPSVKFGHLALVESDAANVSSLMSKMLNVCLMWRVVVVAPFPCLGIELPRLLLFVFWILMCLLLV